jgi:hypothetical protein
VREGAQLYRPGAMSLQRAKAAEAARKESGPAEKDAEIKKPSVLTAPERSAAPLVAGRLHALGLDCKAQALAQATPYMLAFVT